MPFDHSVGVGDDELRVARRRNVVCGCSLSGPTGVLPRSPVSRERARQVAYLEAKAPDGPGLDLQFFEDTAKADSELGAASRQLPHFFGTTIGNVLVFSHDVGQPLPINDVDALRHLVQ